MSAEISEKTEPPSKHSNAVFPLLQLIPQTKENKFFFENGFSRLIPRLTVKVHSNIEECYELWNLFSPDKTLFQLWDFRFAWYRGYGYMPYFYTIYERKKPMAVLPLWYNDYERVYEWFGSDWPEDNVFFLSDPEYFPLLVKIAPKPFSLRAIRPEDIPAEMNGFFSEDEPKYHREVPATSTFEELLSSFSKKHRYHLRHEYTKMSSLPLLIEWKTGQDQLVSLSNLRDLSVQRFEGKQKGSTFSNPKRFNTFHNIFKNQGRYSIVTLSVKVQNHFAVIDIIGIYRKNYYLLQGANDTFRFPGTGVFVTYLELEDAVKRGIRYIDALQDDNNWKHKYFLPKRMMKYVDSRGFEPLTSSM